MNASFIMLGLAMAIGSLLIYAGFRLTRASLIGFSFMPVAGIGTLLDGMYPENTVAALHGLGAFLAFAIGNLAMAILSLALRRETDNLRVLPLLTAYWHSPPSAWEVVAWSGSSATRSLSGSPASGGAAMC